MSLAAGLALDDVAKWPQRIENVTADAVKKAAHWLDRRRSVTGLLLPAEAATASTAAKGANERASQNNF
jgi:zinc protease